jgi:hypothetical protein
VGRRHLRTHSVGDAAGGAHGPAEWKERWKAVPAVDHALRLDAVAVTAGDTELLEHLDRVLEETGLATKDTVLSPAQRRSAGLVTSGSAILSMGRFIAWVSAAAVVAAVVAVALRPEPIEVQAATEPTATTAVPTTTIPPLLERLVPAPADLSGQSPFSGGDTRNAVYEVALGEPIGIYWRGVVSGFIRSDPVLRGRTLYLADSEGFVYGLDITQQGSTIFESRMTGAVDRSPTVEQVAFGQDGQGRVLMFVGDERGNILTRNVNDTDGEVWRADLGSPITGPPLVRPESLIVATERACCMSSCPATGRRCVGSRTKARWREGSAMP